MQSIVAFAFVFVGLVMALVAGPPEVEALGLAMKADDFKSATAHVTRKYTQSHQKGPSTDRVEFDYTVDGRTFHGDNHFTQFGDDMVDIDARVRVVDGEKYITVFYNPEDPSQVLIHRDIGVVIPLAVLIGTALCLYAGVSSFVEARRVRREEFERAEG